MITEHHIGAWALEQHESISQKLFTGISKGFIHILKHSQDRIEAFYDHNNLGMNSKYIHLKDEFYIFFEKDFIMITHPTLRPDRFRFKREGIDSLFNIEEKKYIELYTINGKLNRKFIPGISHALFAKMNSALYTESFKPETILYNSDSLTRIYNESEKKNRNLYEVIVFISSDPEDITVGYDSVYFDQVNIHDSTKYQAIISCINFFKDKITIRAYSSGNHGYYNGTHNVSFPVGFIKTENIRDLSQQDLMLLEYVSNYILYTKMTLEDTAFIDYMNEFKVDKSLY